jgi:hypothetical protein
LSGRILDHVYELARAYAGARRVDGVSFRQIEVCGLETWARELAGGGGLKEVPARSGATGDHFEERGRRVFAIPRIRDRKVPAAVKPVRELIVEADFEDYANGYRPACRAVDAVEEVYRQGYTDVGDADLSKYIDSIRSDDVIKSAATRSIADSIRRTAGGTWG